MSQNKICMGVLFESASIKAKNDFNHLKPLAIYMKSFSCYRLADLSVIMLDIIDIIHSVSGVQVSLSKFPKSRPNTTFEHGLSDFALMFNQRKVNSNSINNYTIVKLLSESVKKYSVTYNEHGFNFSLVTLILSFIVNSKAFKNDGYITGYRSLTSICQNVKLLSDCQSIGIRKAAESIGISVYHAYSILAGYNKGLSLKHEQGDNTEFKVISNSLGSKKIKCSLKDRSSPNHRYKSIGLEQFPYLTIKDFHIIARRVKSIS